MTDCQACTRPSGDNATLCATCSRDLAQALSEVPALVEQLEIVLARQTAHSAGRTARSAEKPLPYDPKASTMLSALTGTLKAWTEEVCETQPEDDTPQTHAERLHAHLETIRHHDDAAQAHDELTSVIADCWKLVDRPTQRIHLGPCPNCEHGALHLTPGDTTARCRSCTHAVPTTELQQHADDHLGTASEITRLLATLGTPLGTSTIRQWAARGRITPRTTTPHGHPMFASATSAHSPPPQNADLL